MYVGQHRYGLYALPSLVDLDTTTISSNVGHLLLEGPLVMSQSHMDDTNVPLSGDHVFISNIDVADDSYQSVKRTENAILLGKQRAFLTRTYSRTLYVAYRGMSRQCIVALFMFFCKCPL